MKSLCRGVRAGLAFVLLPAVFWLGTSAAGAQEGNEPQAGNDSSEEVRRLEERIERIEEDYRRQIEELRAELAALRGEMAAADETRQEDELEALLAEANDLTSEELQREQEAAEQRETFVGGERALQALNPEISFLGDISLDWTDGSTKDGFLARGLELAFQSTLDPYTRFKAVLAGHQEAFELEHHHEDEAEAAEGHEHVGEISVGIEEAYMEWVALPLNTRLRVGKFRQQYGTLNRWHPHSLPSVETPFALQNVFGHEGLAGIGVGLDWQIPRLWATSNGLTVEITNGDNPAAFAGAHWSDPAILLRHTGFFELGPDAYLDLGLNWVRGKNGETNRSVTTVSGLDFAYVWEPVNRSKYRNLELRGEYLHTNFETSDLSSISSDSVYAYLSSRISRRWVAGIRYDDAELPWDRFELYHPGGFREGLRETAWTMYLTFWQSEFVRLRLQYQRASRNFTFPRGGDGDDKLWLQMTFAAGPHKHESY